MAAPQWIPGLKSLGGVEITSAVNGNGLVYVSATNTWLNYGNMYAYDDVATKFYQKEGEWDSTSTTVSTNSANWNSTYTTVHDLSASWNNTNDIKTWTSAQSAYSVSAIAVVSAMPTSANRVANTLYFLLS